MIHSTAIIETGAQIDAGVEIGAYAYIGKDVQIAKGTVVHHHASVEGRTIVGEDNEIFPYAYIGSKTHDLKFKGGIPGLKIGKSNVFREYTTVHLATNDDEFTTVGSHNVLLAYSHIAHDCQIGDHNVISSHAALGGHVEMGNYNNIGWDAGVHQFCKIGSYALLGACSKVVQDVPPYMIVDGNPAVVRTINRVGLERRGFSKEDIELVRSTYKTLYRDGLNRTQAIEKLEAHPASSSDIIQSILVFTKQSKRGFA